MLQQLKIHDCSRFNYFFKGTLIKQVQKIASDEFFSGYFDVYVSEFGILKFSPKRFHIV